MWFLVLIAWTAAWYAAGRSSGKSQVYKSAAMLLYRMRNAGELDEDRVDEIGEGIGITSHAWWRAELVYGVYPPREQSEEKGP